MADDVDIIQHIDAHVAEEHRLREAAAHGTTLTRRRAPARGRRELPAVSVRRGVISDIDALAAWASEIEQWPAGSHLWGHYAEQTATGPAICRTENVSACHSGVAALVDGVLRDLASDTLGEAAADFKDKINYKRPGGAGFGAHQDRLAYPGVRTVVSLLVAIDDCTAASGCLYLARGVDHVLPVDDRGVVRRDVARELEWSAAELAAGDVVCIDGLAPHYSEANRSDSPRRVLVASYAPASEGYTREQYYAARRNDMDASSARDGRFRISTLADFEGAEVPPEVVAIGTCTHA